MRTLASGALIALLLAHSSSAQRSAAASGSAASNGSDWPMYRHDLAGTGFSPLVQIDASNVSRLAQVWSYGLQSTAAPAPTGRGGGGGANSEATPIVANGIMYLPAANRIVALQPDTGKEVWQYPVTGGAPSRRGVAYWPGDGTNAARILFTSGRRLFALNAATGAIEPRFGTNGEVDLVVPYNSVPLVFKNTVIVGANTIPQGAPGNPRAFDARTGAKLWEFNAVAQPGMVGHDTWDGDSWKNRAGANAWPFYFTLDEASGVVYIPLASPIPGAFGGDRKGANLYGNSVVALDAQTGAYKWHFQTIHHDLWDADPPAPPSLFEITQNGRRVPALALTTKSGYLYLLNRDTGQPLHGVEERPVPKSDVPGEATFPTQPIPMKPPPIAKVSYKPDDVVTANDTTPEHAKACADLVAASGTIVNDGPFTPWVFRGEGSAPRSTVLFPGGLGGANWGGTAADPRSGLVYLVTQDDGALGWVEKTREGSPIPYDKTTLPGRASFDVRIGGAVWPCQKPPWGRLMAVNAATGDVAWQTPLGVTDQLPPDKQHTGRPALAGPIATASGLLFVASTDDNRLRAIDAKTGRELWVTRLEKRGNADPLTYQGANGKQYVAVIATDTLVVFALP